MKIVNRKREKKKRINKCIRWEEWKEHFIKMLGKVEEKVVRGRRSERRGGKEEEELSAGKVKRVIEKLKDDKAGGVDEIPNEVWRYERGGGDEGMGNEIL